MYVGDIVTVVIQTVTHMEDFWNCVTKSVPGPQCKSQNGKMSTSCLSII